METDLIVASCTCIFCKTNVVSASVYLCDAYGDDLMERCLAAAVASYQGRHKQFNGSCENDPVWNPDGSKCVEDEEREGH